MKPQPLPGAASCVERNSRNDDPRTVQDTNLIIRDASSRADIAAVRKLCWDYLNHLCAIGPEENEVINALYPTEYYSSLMDRIEQEHAPDKGVIIVAEMNGEVVGCGMIREFAPQIAEVKRVYVSDAARGQNAGRLICIALMDRARDLGYNTIRLDTLRTLAPARKLYGSLGFVQRDAYYDLPEIAKGLVCFYEIAL